MEGNVTAGVATYGEVLVSATIDSPPQPQEVTRQKHYYSPSGSVGCSEREK